MMQAVGIKSEFVERRVRLVGREHAIRRLELRDGSDRARELQSILAALL